MARERDMSWGEGGQAGGDGGGVGGTSDGRDWESGARSRSLAWSGGDAGCGVRASSPSVAGVHVHVSPQPQRPAHRLALHSGVLVVGEGGARQAETVGPPHAGQPSIELRSARLLAMSRAAIATAMSELALVNPCVILLSIVSGSPWGPGSGLRLLAAKSEGAGVPGRGASEAELPPGSAAQVLPKLRSASVAARRSARQLAGTGRLHAVSGQPRRSVPLPPLEGRSRQKRQTLQNALSLKARQPSQSPQRVLSLRLRLGSSGATGGIGGAAVGGGGHGSTGEGSAGAGGAWSKAVQARCAHAFLSAPGPPLRRASRQNLQLPQLTRMECAMHPEHEPQRVAEACGGGAGAAVRASSCRRRGAAALGVCTLRKSRARESSAAGG